MLALAVEAVILLGS